jgi:hypothetical protein
MKKIVIYSVVAVIVGIILPMMVPSLTFWQIILIIGFFGLTDWLKSKKELRKLGIAMNVVVIIVTAIFLFQAIFPMLNKSMPWVIAKGDFESSRIVDKVNLKADITWEEYRNKNSEQMLKTYRSYLNGGKTQEAALVEQEFYNKWNKSRIEDSLKNAKAKLNTNANANVNAPANPNNPPTPNGISTASEELTVGAHTYLLKKGEMTGWKKIPGDCIYDVMCYGPQPLYKIYYSDGDLVDFTDGIDKELPRKTTPELRIASNADQTMVINVKKRNVI